MNPLPNATTILDPADKQEGGVRRIAMNPLPSPTARWRPEGVKATARAGLVWWKGNSRPGSAPGEVCQSRAVPSTDAVAIRLPCGWKASPITRPVLPGIVRTTLVARFNRWTGGPEPSDVAARVRESGLNARHVMRVPPGKVGPRTSVARSMSCTDLSRPANASQRPLGLNATARTGHRTG